MTVEASSVEPDYRMGRRELLALTSAIIAVNAMGVDLMLSAFDEIRDEFALGAGSTETSRVITIYLLGMAVGQLFFGPVADRFGRKRALYAGVVVYILGAAGSALAASFGSLLVARLIWGLGAAAARVVASAIIRDRFEGAAMASAMSMVMAVFLLVPIIAPSFGAVLISVFPWRSVFWFAVIFALVIVGWSFRLRETLAPENRRELNPKAVASGYVQVARTPVTFGYTMASVFLQGGFITYLAGSESLISNVFDRQEQFPVIFGVVAVMFGGASVLNSRIVERLGIDTVVNRALVGVSGALALLLLITLLSSGHPNFWVFMPLLGFAMACFLLIQPNISAAAMLPLGAIAGSGAALTGATRIAGGAILGGVISEQIETSTTPMVVGLTVMVACCGSTVWLVRQGGVRAVIAR